MDTELDARLEDRIAAWRIDVERVAETGNAIFAFGSRDRQPVVLKLIRNPGDEWRSGATVDAFDRRGVVRAYEFADGAMLLEHLRPGTSLVDVARSGDDSDAMAILADVIGRMCPRAAPAAVPTAERLAQGFERYLASGNPGLPSRLVREAHDVYRSLCRSQRATRLLHGDLHHANVLFDSDRGWLAVDPKGVLGELEYEIGAALRNPVEQPTVFGSPAAIERRVDRFGRSLGLDVGRILAWGFAQAVLAAIWAIEDGCGVAPIDAWIQLASAIRPQLSGRWPVEIGNVAR